MRRVVPFAFFLIALVAACSHGGRSGLPPGPSPGLLTPKSVSPALITPAPMAHTAILPASAMTSPTHPNIAVASLSWSQVPGTASAVAAAPDGSLWAISDQPAGADKYIWHFVNGAWSNVSGLASAIAVAQDGSVWAVNSGGGIYHYANGTWSPLGGGASGSITADSAGGIYVLTNAGSGADRAIWYWTSGSGWIQQSGSGTALAANLDKKSYTVGPGGSGTINPGGVYIVNSSGGIYYENTDKSFAQLPGAASAIAPTANGGIFVLGYPSAQTGNQIYYYNLDSPGWTQEPGSGLLSISTNTNLYLVNSANAIYTAPLPVPAYCGAINYSPASGGIPIDITDDSGTGAVLVIYIQNGGSTWLAQNGAFNSATPNPLPAACFSTTKSSNGTVPLVIPTGVSGGRIYLALATPNPNGAIPNPFGDVNAPTSGPPVGYQAAPFPWDKLEYGTILSQTPVIDTTQVDSLGLPIELSVSASATATPMPDNTPGACVANPVTAGSSGPYGVTSCKFANIFTTIAASQQYSPLIYTASFNGRLLDMQVVSPSQAGHTSFAWNAAMNGYVQSVLASYQSTSRLFTNLVSGAQNPQPSTATYYCASSDGSSNFLFTNIGTGTMCPGTPKAGVSPNPFKVPAALFAYATVPLPAGTAPPVNGCIGNLTFSQPFGLAYVDGAQNDPLYPTSQLFATNDAFAMWKALTADLNYGMALNTTQTHPVGQVSPPPITPGALFQDSTYNMYDKVLHDNFNGGLAYGIPYDDLYNLESGVALSSSGGAIVLRINPIPPASSVTPGSQPAPVSVPIPCPTITPGVGSY